MHPAIEEIRAAEAKFKDIWGDLEALKATEANRRIADAAVDGIIFFYGNEPVQVGRKDIDWTGAHIKHQEWRAQLNRFFQLTALCVCYRETDEKEYARAARAFMEDWISRHPPIGPDEPAYVGDSSLNMTIRLGALRGGAGWLRTLGCLYGAAGFDDDFVDRVLESVDWQLAWLKNNLAGRSNWRIAGLCGLVEAALLLPSRYGHCMDFAARELENEFYTQILPDGAHEERSAGYHNWMARTFLLLDALGKRADVEAWSLDPERLAAGDYHSLAHLRPNGAVSRFNDAGGLLGTPEGTDPMPRKLEAHRELRRKLGVDPEPPLDGVFPEGGLCFFRTDWDAAASWLGFDAVPEYPGGHLHLSRLSIEYHRGGRTVLPDPGILSYEMSTWYGPAGKATRMHSTCNVDMLSQSDTGARLLNTKTDREFSVAHGRYEGGYWPGRFDWGFYSEGRGRGVYGTHDRLLIWARDRCIVAIDNVATDRGHHPHCHWLLDRGPLAQSEDGRCVWTTRPENNLLVRILALEPTPQPELTVYEGDEKQGLGWLAETNDNPVPAPLLSWKFAEGPMECATVIIPFDTERPEVQMRLLSAPENAQRVLQLRWPDGRLDEFAWTLRLMRGLGTYTVDGEERFSLSALRIRSEQEGNQAVDWTL